MDHISNNLKVIRNLFLWPRLEFQKRASVQPSERLAPLGIVRGLFTEKTRRKKKWNSIWFKINRKTVTTILSYSIWKEMEIVFSVCNFFQYSIDRRTRSDVMMSISSWCQCYAISWRGISQNWCYDVRHFGKPPDADKSHPDYFQTERIRS